MAGDRPGRIRRRGRSRPALRRLLTLLVAALAIAAVLLGPLRTPIRNLVTSVKDRVSVGDHLAVATVAASSSLGDHSPALLLDGVTTTWWAEGAAGDGQGATLTFTFATPVDIDHVLVFSGVHDPVGQPGQFIKQPRPRELLLTFDDGVHKQVKVHDAQDQQTIAVVAKHVSELTIVVPSVYPGSTGHDLAISEVEFRGHD